jgi:hypothetical protein
MRVNQCRGHQTTVNARGHTTRPLGNLGSAGNLPPSLGRRTLRREEEGGAKGLLQSELRPGRRSQVCPTYLPGS